MRASWCSPICRIFSCQSASSREIIFSKNNLFHGKVMFKGLLWPFTHYMYVIRSRLQPTRSVNVSAHYFRKQIVFRFDKSTAKAQKSFAKLAWELGKKALSHSCMCHFNWSALAPPYCTKCIIVSGRFSPTHHILLCHSVASCRHFAMEQKVGTVGSCLSCSDRPASEHSKN